MQILQDANSKLRAFIFESLEQAELMLPKTTFAKTWMASSRGIFFLLTATCLAFLALQ